MAAPLDILSAVTSAEIQRVTFRSQVTPDYVYDPSAPSPPPSGGSSWLMPLVKPSVTIDTPQGPITFAPYGTPTEDYATPAAIGGVALLVGLVVLIGWIARAIK